jgi:hypothetical protein
MRYSVSRENSGSHFISRREFTVEWVLAMLAGVTITIAGCGSDSNPSPSPSPTPSPTPSPSPGTAADVSGVVSANHGHVATVTAAQITAANSVVLNIMGTATHNHTVSLTADQIRAIGARTQVAVASSTEVGHDHTVTFN